MIRTITAAATGPADVVLRVLTIKGGQVTVIGDPAAVTATITLAPVRTGDRVAEDCIDTAEIHAQGARLVVTVPAARPRAQAHTATIHSGGGSVVIQGNAVIGPGSVVAGGTGIVGSVGPAAPADTAGVWAEIRVPAGSDVYVTAAGADVIVQGVVRAEIATAGIVRTEPL